MSILTVTVTVTLTYILECLHRWDHKGFCPALVVEVVGSEEVVRGVDCHKYLPGLFLALHVFVGVPFETHLAKPHLDLVKATAAAAGLEPRVRNPTR